jgi:predicted HTH domain antitoxin
VTIAWSHAAIRRSFASPFPPVSLTGRAGVFLQLPDNEPVSRLAQCVIRVHLLIMQLILPEAIETKLSPREAALHLAIGLFVSEEATLGQAAEIAGLAQADFLKELGRRRIPIHYGPDELAEDLKVVESFHNR